MTMQNIDDIWSSAIAAVKRAGRRVALEAAKAFYVARDPRTPPHVKAVLYSALIYFGLPSDAIPDFTPGVGFSDDLTALAAALLAANVYVTQDSLQAATHWVDRIFG